MFKYTDGNQEIKIQVASTFFSRFKGLMGRRELQDDEALLLWPCSSIHTFFMKFHIDVVFLSKDNYIVNIVKDIPPWSIWPPVKGSSKVLEFKGGTLDRLSIKKGEKLEFIPCTNHNME
ncbi:DUF192 domain-containing protein [Desulfitibacter alkalitolerans]|uniref:DUF192 domain-containing protein n=1 Tax=Desulfitibacter alkalitolerans TaxID=264641 RepID=UPI000487733D|nr:DUF192 domain-containing protein [Desulfitibacter alkalitolerans]